MNTINKDPQGVSLLQRYYAAGDAPLTAIADASRLHALLTPNSSAARTTTDKNELLVALGAHASHLGIDLDVRRSLDANLKALPERVATVQETARERQRVSDILGRLGYPSEWTTAGVARLVAQRSLSPEATRAALVAAHLRFFEDGIWREEEAAKFVSTFAGQFEPDVAAVHALVRRDIHSAESAMRAAQLGAITQPEADARARHMLTQDLSAAYFGSASRKSQTDRVAAVEKRYSDLGLAPPTTDERNSARAQAAERASDVRHVRNSEGLTANLAFIHGQRDVVSDYVSLVTSMAGQLVCKKPELFDTYRAWADRQARDVREGFAIDDGVVSELRRTLERDFSYFHEVPEDIFLGRQLTEPVEALDTLARLQDLAIATAADIERFVPVLIDRQLAAAGYGHATKAWHEAATTMGWLHDKVAVLAERAGVPMDLLWSSEKRIHVNGHDFTHALRYAPFSVATDDFKDYVAAFVRCCPVVADGRTIARTLDYLESPDAATFGDFRTSVEEPLRSYYRATLRRGVEEVLTKLRAY